MDELSSKSLPLNNHPDVESVLMHEPLSGQRVTAATSASKDAGSYKGAKENNLSAPTKQDYL